MPDQGRWWFLGGVERHPSGCGAALKDFAALVINNIAGCSGGVQAGSRGGRGLFMRSSPSASGAALKRILRVIIYDRPWIGGGVDAGKGSTGKGDSQCGQRKSSEGAIFQKTPHNFILYHKHLPKN